MVKMGLNWGTTMAYRNSLQVIALVKPAKYYHLGDNNAKASYLYSRVGLPRKTFFACFCKVEMLGSGLGAFASIEINNIILGSYPFCPNGNEIQLCSFDILKSGFRSNPRAI